MKKLVLSLVLALAGVLNVKADLLYWMVDNPKDVGGNSLDYTYASIAVAQDISAGQGKYTASGYLNNYFSGSSVENGVVIKDIFGSSAVAAILGTDYSSQSFFIELYDADMNARYQSEVFTLLSPSAYITSAVEFNSNWSMTQSAGGLGGAFAPTAVPEPTSGLLLLIGAAMMGLRRKRIA